MQREHSQVNTEMAAPSCKLALMVLMFQMFLFSSPSPSSSIIMRRALTSLQQFQYPHPVVLGKVNATARKFTDEHLDRVCEVSSVK